ncbi:MAG: pyruvate kinase [Ardenticatenaceae bacterium]|nr:pyruvate kinase [Ardenticatenaceae bacterium]
MSRTKIVATIGPASNQPETIRRMLAAGMTVARINFSHGDHESHRATIETLRRVADAENRVLALLGDLQGPKLRLGQVKTGGLQLALGDEILLTSHPGQPAMIHFPHEELFPSIRPGARLVIGDGEVEFTVADNTNNVLRCIVTVAGLLESRKGVNIPGTLLPISSITDKDKEDLAFICQMDLDYVALSFVREANDIHELRALMDTYGKRIPIIAKIEKSEAIEHLEDIRDAADGMMVARGDLGIDMPPQEVPLLQKRIIETCNIVGKPVITATQMLQSMVEHPRPTRAEASDVANAILDGTDAVMLSGETASGKYPVESVLMMKHISEITEKAFPYDKWRSQRWRRWSDFNTVTEAISGAACDIAEEIVARAIVSATLSGGTARHIARHRPHVPVMAVSPSRKTQRLLALIWGVDCVLVPDFSNTDVMLRETVNAMKSFNLVPGDKLVITAGVPFGQTGHTNLIQVHEIS